jgi:hypothetical protein
LAGVVVRSIRCWGTALVLVVACRGARQAPSGVVTARKASNAAPSSKPPAPPQPEAVAERSASSSPPAPDQPTVVECRSTADCAKGLRCCTDPIGDTQASICQPDCDAHEACVPGSSASCSGALACQAVPGTRAGGYCMAAAPSVACGGTRCSGKKPGCCHSLSNRREHCIAVTAGRDAPADRGCDPGPDNFVILCRSPADCGGEHCCTHGFYPITACEGACATGIDVCATIADCPYFGGPPTGCSVDPDGLPGVKICRYAFPESPP